MKPDEKLALNNCDKEPVHIPGRIQPFGALLGFDLETGIVRYQSENFGPLFFDSDANHIGKSYEEVITNREIVHAIRGALGLPTIRSQRDRVGVFELISRETDVSVYATPETAVVEFEQDSAKSSMRLQSPVLTVRSMMTAVREGEGLETLLDSSVQALRHLTGHDRVMAYKFLDNDDGEVVAEAKGPGIEPYLGLRYPAWDIPTQVRQIMLRAPFRVIADTRMDHFGMISEADAPPLDMSLGHLRGVSPIHLEYLENMGVRATMNTSLIVRGRLWGLFAFHHYRPKNSSPDQRSICELFGQLVSMMIQQEEERERQSTRRRTQSTIASIDSSGSDLNSVVDRLSSDLMEIVESDGVGLLFPDTVKLVGETTSESVIREVAGGAKDELLAIESLSTVQESNNGDLGKTAGLLMLRLPRNGWLTFFRNEVIHEIRWAGGKEKEIKVGPNGPRLSPRGSFAEYKESVAGRCNPWTEANLASASEICRELWKMMQVTALEHTEILTRQKQYQDLLIAELNHRVRNTLALVRSIARQTTSSSTSLEQYVQMLEQRIAALSKAHDLIGGSGLQWARIGDLVRAELKPYEFDQQSVTVDGSTTAVRADVAPILALLFHEMTSNAAKHGALSGKGGSLKVNWKDDAGGVSIVWLEELVDEIHESERHGFGFALIERALPYECNGKSSIEFSSNQMKISFWLPAETIHRLADQDVEPKISDQPEEVPEVPFDLSTIKSMLVVEDNMILAMELERMLLDLGVQHVDTLPNVDLAKAAIEKVDYDCAVLDINLGEETSIEVGSKLIENGVAVVLASGYDSKYELPESFADIERLTKPIGRVDLVNAIRVSLAEQG